MDFIPPHNKEFEEAIIGSILYEPDLLKKSALIPSDFYYEKNQKYFGIFLDLQKASAPIDLITAGEAVSKAQIEDGLAEINEFMSKVISTAHFDHYEAQVREMSLKRKLIKVFVSGISTIEEISSDETISLVRRKFTHLLSSRPIDLVSMMGVTKEIFNFIERRSSNRGAFSGIPSGLKELDEATDGFQGSDYIIVAGRPGSGKSALMMHIAQNAAMGKIPVGVLHLEMGIHQVGIRSISSMSEVPMWRIRKGSINASDWPKLTQAAGEMSDLPIWFSFTAMESRAISRVITSMVEEKECKMIMLDYLQLAHDKEIEHREREVATISAMLKGVTKMYNIPVVAVAQLNRAVEKEKRKPRMSDLRESGAIEQDADVILFLHKEDEDSQVLEIIVGKGRNIGTGSCKVFWDKERMIFKDLAKREEK